MDEVRLVQAGFELLRLIPRGKVISYKKFSQALGLSNPRLVGRILQKNEDKLKIPCYKVVRSDGKLSKGYKFGGASEQKKLLQAEGVRFSPKGVRIAKRFFFSPTKVLSMYFSLVKKYGIPPDWPWTGKGRYTQDQIIISSVLTQNVSWRNVEKAMLRLRDKNLITLEDLVQAEESLLLDCIKPAGFFQRKYKALRSLARYILDKGRDYFEKKPLSQARAELLGLYGIGPETADTILLYGFNRKTFVIDAYTKRFVEKNLKIKIKNYDSLKKFFEQNIPCDLALYKNYHALIVIWGKDERKR